MVADMGGSLHLPAEHLQGRRRRIDEEADLPVIGVARDNAVVLVVPRVGDLRGLAGVAIASKRLALLHAQHDTSGSSR
jgi:hypothetical protein